jgi:hypothetical protein
MTYVALLIDNLHGDLLEMHLRHLGDFMVVLAVVERSLRGPPRAASCAAEA